jgi:hypothetical protein
MLSCRSPTQPNHYPRSQHASMRNHLRMPACYHQISSHITPFASVYFCMPAEKIHFSSTCICASQLATIRAIRHCGYQRLKGPRCPKSDVIRGLRQRQARLAFLYLPRLRPLFTIYLSSLQQPSILLAPPTSTSKHPNSSFQITISRSTQCLLAVPRCHLLVVALRPRLRLLP